MIEEFAGLKAKMHLFSVDENSENRKAKLVNRNVVAMLSHDEYKDALLNNKCLRHSLNRIQCTDQRIGTYEINKITFPCLDNKIYIQNDGMRD